MIESEKPIKTPLLVVEAAFQVSGIGLVLCPCCDGEKWGDMPSGRNVQARLMRPDSTQEIVEITFDWQHFRPGGFCLMCVLRGGTKSQVPPGTQVWLLDEK